MYVWRGCSCALLDQVRGEGGLGSFASLTFPANGQWVGGLGGVGGGRGVLSLLTRA